MPKTGPILAQILSFCRPAGQDRVSLAAVNDLLAHLDCHLKTEGFSREDISAMHRGRVQLPEIGDKDETEKQILAAIDQGKYATARKLLVAHSKSIHFKGQEFEYPYLHPMHKTIRLNDGHPRAIDLAARADFRTVVEKLLAIDYSQSPGTHARKFIYATNTVGVQDTKNRFCGLTYQESFASAAAIYAQRGDIDLATRLIDKHIHSPSERRTNMVFISEGLTDFMVAAIAVAAAEPLVIKTLEEYRHLLFERQIETIKDKLATIQNRDSFTARVKQLLN